MNGLKDILLCRTFDFGLPRTLEAFLRCSSIIIAFLGYNWLGRWYSTNGCGHNLIIINLTGRNKQVSCVEQILWYIIFDFGLPKVLMAL